MSNSIMAKLAGVLTFGMLMSVTALAYGGHAAIVFNKSTGAWGAYHGANSRAAAENRAIGFCGASCAGVDAGALESGQSGLNETFVYNGWIALAKGQNGAYGTSGNHGSQYDAEVSALTNCGGDANGCYVVRSVSSFDYTDDMDGTRPGQ
jgi:hypothetical protein